MEGRGLVVDCVARDRRAHDLRGDAVAARGAPLLLPPARHARAPRSASIMRDTGGGFGQKVLVQRDEMCLMLAAPKVGAPVKWVEDRRENLLAAGQVAPRARRRHDGVRRRRRHPGRPHRLRLRLRRVPDAVAGRPRGRRRHAVPRAVPRAPRRLRDQDDLHEHRRAHRVPRAVAVRVARPRGAARHRGAPDGHRPGRAPPAQPAAPRRPAVREPERHDLRQHLAARDVRAGAGDARLRRVPRRAGRGPRGRPLPRRRPVQLRRAVDARLRLLRAPRRRRSASSRRAR